MIYGYTFNFKDAFSAMIENGQYAVQVKIEKNKKLLFGYRIYVNVIRV
jgi:hypothetical protein